MNEKWRIASVVSIVLDETNKSINILDVRARPVINKLLEKPNRKEFTDELQGLQDLKIECGVLNNNPYTHIFIKHDILPDKESWYRVENFYVPMIREIINNTTIRCGVVDDDISILVSSTSGLGDKVAFVTPNSPNFDEYSDEAIRSICLEIGEKTTKWIPGHRYNTPEDTFILLGKTKNKFTGKNCWIVVKKLNKERTISEVLKNRSDLIVLYKLPAYVDTGEVLNDDVTIDKTGTIEIEKYYANIINNHANDTFIDFIVETISLYSKENPDIPRDLITNLLSQKAEKALSDLWSNNIKSSRVITKDTQENVAILKIKAKLFNPISPFQVADRIKLFDVYGIDLDDIIKHCLNNWNEDDFCSSFDNYLNHLNYFMKKEASNKKINTASFSSSDRNRYLSDKFYPIANVYGNSHLFQLLHDIIFEAENNYGVGDCDYKMNNFGEVTINIDINSILKRYKGKENIPENLKDDILKRQFCSLEFKYRIDDRK